MKIDVRNGQAFDNINNIVREFPKFVGTAGYDFARIQKRNLQLELLNQNSIGVSNTPLYNSIKAKRVSRFVSTVSMPLRGIYLDRAQPHWVALKRGRNITNWAEAKYRYRFNGKLPGAIFVKPHPFIEKATIKSFTKLRNTIRVRTKQALEKRT